GDVEHVVAAAEADVADDARRRDAGGDRGLLHGRAAVVGRQVDRDVPVGRGERAARADRAAVFDRIDGPRQIDDRSRRTAVAAGLGGDRAAVADQRDIAAGLDDHCRRDRGRVLAAGRRLDLARVADFGGRRAAADADGGCGLVLRLRRHAARAADADAAGDGHRAAEAADLDRVAVLARIKAVAEHRAIDDETKAGAGPGDGADRDVAIGRADADRGRRAE